MVIGFRAPLWKMSLMNPLVRLELIRESLIAVVNEMRANIVHPSYAPIIT